MTGEGQAKGAKDHSRVPELDGIRAIAIWLVLAGHVGYGWPNPSGSFDHIPSVILQIVAHGWLGVDLFFVLSGFLITGILLDTKESPRYFQNFYMRRVLRILPLYAVFVGICSAFYKGYRSYFILSTVFAANLAHLFGVRVPHGPGVLWSLAVEEHFYLLWPLLVFLLSRRNLTVLAILIIVGTPVARGLAVAHGMDVDAAVYTYSWFRFDGLALGGIVAIWIRSPKSSGKNSVRLVACLVVASLLITLLGLPFGLMQKGILGTALRFNQAQLIFGAGLLLALVLRTTPYVAFLRHPFARLSGSLSYCIYLVHLSIGDSYQFVVEHFGWHPDKLVGGLGSVILRGVVMIFSSFIVALISRKYLEEPFLSLKRHF
jgi:peptidoglycan/LPS O-acetylase OafA/YrhL